MKIVFMGTPDFAVPCLQRIIDMGHKVTGVFTQPDKPKGRGMELAPPPVKELALKYGITVYQPEKLRDGTALEILRKLEPDLIVVVAYGRILPKEILMLPPLGCVNVHGSLLPKYRGAAPIQWSVINGDAVTGVTTMYMDEGMDTGDMILKSETAIGEDETAGELFDRLCGIGADCLEETLKLIGEGRAPRTPQDHGQATHAPMLEKKMGEIDFGKSAGELHNLIRGLSPWPGAYTKFGGKLLKIHGTKPVQQSGQPGEILDAERAVIACGSGAIELLVVQPEGKARMSGAEFLRGRRLSKGDSLITGAKI